MRYGCSLAACVLAVAALAGCEALGWQWGTGRPAARTVEADEPTDEQRQSLDEARVALDTGEYDEALRLFRAILAENPTITTAYLGVGEIHMVRGDYERAEPAYARAARLEPRNFDAQYGHGLALQMLGRLADAVRAYHRALTIDPEHPKANLNLATTYLQLENARSARVFAEKAVEADPENGAARVNLGAIYEQLGRNSEAIDQYLVAMELLDDTVPVMKNLIKVLGEERRYRELINTAEHLVRVEPDANAYERMAWAYFRLGEYERSVQAYRQAVQIDPDHWQSWRGIGVNALNRWLLSERRDGEAFEQARQAFRRSLRINPDQRRLVTLMSNYGL